MAFGFRFVKADEDEKILLDSYRLRYEIYCNEVKFLDGKDYPDGMERDEFDKHAIHFAAIDINGTVVGTTRLILNSGKPFPLERQCKKLNIDPKSLPRDTMSEISRLIVAKDFRRRVADGQTGIESYPLDYKVHTPPSKDGPEKRQKPIIVLGLVKLLYQTSKKLGITHWYAAMEKNLWQSLRNFSFYLDPIGPEFDYYGLVSPYMAHVPEFEKRLLKENEMLYNLLREGMVEEK